MMVQERKFEALSEWEWGGGGGVEIKEQEIRVCVM